MDALLRAFTMVGQPEVLLTIVVSSIFGLVVGFIPGLTATMATALLVPFAMFLDPVSAIASIVAATAMAIFAGDIPGTLLRLPGTPAVTAAALPRMGAGLCTDAVRSGRGVPG